MTPALSSLLERLERAEGADKALDREIANALLPWHGPDNCYPPHFAPPVTSSLDAALELVERKLPGWGRTVAHYHPEEDFQVALEQPEWDRNNPNFAGWHQRETHATLIALLRALSSTKTGG